MTPHLSRRTLLLASGAAALGGLTGCAPAQSSYQPSGPRIVDVVVPYSAGGGTDTWARFITPYFAERQEGIDRYQVENTPGGESITGTNAYTAAGVTGGRQLLVSSATTYFQNMLGHHTANFDFSAMEPLVLNGTGAVLYAGGASGIRSAADLMERRERPKLGGISASGLDLVPLLALEALGVKVDGIFGFEGRGPSRLAVQRNETDLDFQTTSSYLSQIQPLVDQGKAHPILSVGVLENGRIVRDPNVPDIPTVDELLREFRGADAAPIAFEAYRSFVTPGFFFQKGLWSNAGTDQEVVDTYHRLTRSLNDDAEFRAESTSALGGYDLVSGRSARADFRAAIDLDPEVLSFTKDFLTAEHGAVLD
ncbi:hypothetical protein [Kocuria rosea]|uniref:Tripartite-type tricarboxylate transporter receptor subunit TctC n=1 Tax=Kocuria rosea TaxID=1275 RepID=A0A4R5YHQ2_KOCRO|nr:hypothetical protein [Kocuria rosea]TDL44416.1 hypothetical protein E2R59_04840 [Kocuria rosea]